VTRTPRNIGWVRATIPDAVVDRAAGGYTDHIDDTERLPYHNWGHVADTLDAAGTLLNRCARHDVPVDRGVVALALLFHDAAYHRDPESCGHPDRETHSATLARNALADEGYEQSRRDRVADTILATRPDADVDALSTEGMLVRAADLRGLGTDYATFEQNTEQLRKERALLSGERPSRSAWAVMTVRTVADYLAEDLRLTPEHDGDGVSAFHARTGRNLGLLLGEYCDAETVDL
jgi:predicted metal-dependent HD superfamily phosphohydrolase